jgi:hypothetical protein
VSAGGFLPARSGEAAEGGDPDRGADLVGLSLMSEDIPALAGSTTEIENGVAGADGECRL